MAAQLYLSAPQKSSGKTTLSIALSRELRRRGLDVQPFKKGPDYIDPLWLSRAAGRDCLNLDFHTTSDAEIRTSVGRALADADLGIIEGNVGLFDSIHLDGAHSNAELAKLLDAPVILVINSQGMARGIAPLLLGYQAFDPALKIAGVVLNKVGGGRHAENLRRVVEHYTDLQVIGAVPRHIELAIEERHLGLIPSNEAEAVDQTIERLRQIVCEHLDVDALLGIADSGSFNSLQQSLIESLSPYPAGSPAADYLDFDEQSGLDSLESDRSKNGLRIGLAQDDAFGFYYPDDLRMLERQGAELVPFSPVHDAELPSVDALILGGGFPECRMRELAENWSMRASIRDFIESGGPAYAECGGLMYLSERLHWKGEQATMCAVLRRDVAMGSKPRGRGYMRLQETSAHPWPRGSTEGADISAHEFHHSAIVDPDPDWTYAYKVKRGEGIDGQHDGIRYKRLLANYAHLRNVGGVNWTDRFLAFARYHAGQLSIDKPLKR